MSTVTIDSQTNSTTGAAATGTSTTVTLPTGYAGKTVIFVLCSNNSIANQCVFGVDISNAAPINNADNRVAAWSLIPNGSPTTFGLSWTTSSVYRWICFALSNVDGYLNSVNPLGSNTTSTMATAAIASLGFTTTGEEMIIEVASVNASATWTDPADDIYQSTTGNCGTLVCAHAPSAGDTSYSARTFDRGLGGTARNESLMVLYFFPSYTPDTNMFGAGNLPLTLWDANGNQLQTLFG